MKGAGSATHDGAAPWQREGQDAFLRRMGSQELEVSEQALQEFVAAGPKAVLWVRDVIVHGLPSEQRLRLLLWTLPTILIWSLVLAMVLERPLASYQPQFVVLSGLLAPIMVRLMVLNQSDERRTGMLRACRALASIRTPDSIGPLVRLLRTRYRTTTQLRELLDAETIRTAAYEAARSAMVALAALLAEEQTVRAIRSPSDRALLLQALASVERMTFFADGKRCEHQPYCLAVVTAHQWLADPGAVGPLRVLAERDGGPPYFTPPALVRAAGDSLEALERNLQEAESSRALPRPAAQPEADLAALPVISARERGR